MTKKEKFISMSDRLMKKANEMINKYQQTGKEKYIRNACEDGWGAWAQIVKAYKYPEEVKSHKKITDTIICKNGKPVKMSIGGKACATTLHSQCFYEGEINLNTIKDFLNCMNDGRKEIKKIISES